jgi:hypothetical protein
MSQVTNPQKANRSKFGIVGAAIPAVKAFRKAMKFDHADVVTASWILIRPDGQRTHANTYNGELGKNVDYTTNTFEMPDAKKAKKVFKGYEEVPVEECPVAILVNGGTTEPELPKTEPTTTEPTTTEPTTTEPTEPEAPESEEDVDEGDDTDEIE